MPNRRRILTVVLAPCIAVAAWGVFQLFGVDLVVSSGSGRSTVGAGSVVASALAAALAGWLVARVIERRARRPRLAWARVSSTALAISLIGPSWLAHGSGVALALGALHV